MKTKDMVIVALFAAIIIVMASVPFLGYIPLGVINATVIHVPVIIGSVILGAKCGAILGFVFGLVVVIQCATGVDAGGFILWGINPFLTALICLVKGTAAGLVPGLLYRAINKKGEFTLQHGVGAVVAAISAPIVNTGLFLIGLSTCFNSTLVEWAGGTDVIMYVITGLVGINFVIELCINIVVSPAISTVIKVLDKQVTK